MRESVCLKNQVLLRKFHKILPLFSPPKNKKVRQPESAHRKTQTPIVAAQKKIDGITLQKQLVEIAFLPNSSSWVQMSISPYKIESSPLENIRFCVA